MQTEGVTFQLLFLMAKKGCDTVLIMFCYPKFSKSFMIFRESNINLKV